jgi:hypothetical protein
MFNVLFWRQKYGKQGVNQTIKLAVAAYLSCMKKYFLISILFIFLQQYAMPQQNSSGNKNYFFAVINIEILYCCAAILSRNLIF